MSQGQLQPQRLIKSIDALSGDVVFTLRVPSSRAQTIEAILRRVLELAQPLPADGSVQTAAADAQEAAAWRCAPQMGYPYGYGMPQPGYMPFPGYPPYGFGAYPPPGACAPVSQKPWAVQASPAVPGMPAASAEFAQSAARQAEPGIESAASPEPGKRLRRLRRSRGLTQKALADSIRTTQSRISEFEAGVRAIPVPCAQVLAELFGVSVDEFLEE